MTLSDASSLLALLSDDELSNLSPDELGELLSLVEAEEEADSYDWDKQCLPYQRIPHNVKDCPWVSREYGAGKAGHESFNAIAWICGYGAGKTTTLIRNLQSLVEQGKYKRIGIITPSEKLYREEIALPLQSKSPNWCKAVYRPTESKIIWPSMGAQAILLSATRPELIRGFNLDLLACDELVAWQHPESYVLGRARLRLGDNPLTLIATTPKSTPLIWSILNDPNCAVIRASTYDNTKLSPAALKAVIDPWIGHPLFEQEILGIIHERILGALWTQDIIAAHRVTAAPELARIVVGVDPGGYGGVDDQGVTVAAKGEDGRYYILADYGRAKGTPTECANDIVRAYNDWQAGCVVVETNNGGDWIPTVLTSIDPNINIKKVHASTGKLTRAEPISAMYVRGEVSHCGTFHELEKQLREWVPGKRISPGRLDALVFALTELSGRSRELRVY